MTSRSALLALLSAAPPAVADVTGSRGAQILGWTADGLQVAWEESVSYETPEPATETFSCLQVVDREGRAVRAFRRYRSDFQEPLHDPPPCWEKADEQSAGEAWLAANKLQKPAAPAGVPDAKALAAAASDGKTPKLHGAPAALWSPDGTRVAVLWALTGKGEDEPERKLAVLTRRALATVDLLDAGAGEATTALAARIEKAGFRIAHRGNAQSQRPTTMIYFAPGFETEARELGRLAGAAPEAVQPLSWKSPHAITVAAGPAPAAGR